MLAETPVEFNLLEIPAKTLIFSAKINQFLQENIFHNFPVRRIADAMNTTSAFTKTYTEDPFWYQQVYPRQKIKLRCSQPIVDLNSAKNFRPCVTETERKNC